MTQINEFLLLCARDEVARLLLQKHRDAEDDSMEVILDDVAEWPEMKVLSVGRPRIIDTMREMDRLGVVSYTVGRHGRSTRIMWKFKPEDIPGEAELAASVAPQTPAPAVDSPAETRMAPPDESSLNHTFHLRPDLAVSFSLPKDLTEAEAERVASFVRTLPFGLQT